MLNITILPEYICRSPVHFALKPEYRSTHIFAAIQRPRPYDAPGDRSYDLWSMFLHPEATSGDHGRPNKNLGLVIAEPVDHFCDRLTGV